MSSASENQGGTDRVVYNGSHRWGLVIFAKVALILGLWVIGFIAFLVAPLLVLLVAWVVGLAILAVRHRGRDSAPAAPAPGSHRFGTRRAPANAPGGDAR
ncbi:MAG: hypothetical protein JHD16_12725 [Solirubrobacteraceae bacterium]|nr:hypothetical protein [Solirubrobacteraceae bacterium]